MKRLNKNLELETLQNRFCNHEKLRWKYMELPTLKGLIWKMTFFFKVLIFRFYVSCFFGLFFFLRRGARVRWDPHGGKMS